MQAPHSHSRRELGPLMAIGGIAALSAVATTFASTARASHAAPVRPARVPIEDRFAILDMFALYSWSYDCGDAESYASLFTDDGVLETIISTTKGRANIAAYIPTLLAMHGDEVWQHHSDQVLFFGSGDRYSVYSYWSVFKGKDPNYGVMGFGYYLTECVRQNGRWYFQKRSIHKWDATQLPWTQKP